MEEQDKIIVEYDTSFEPALYTKIEKKHLKQIDPADIKTKTHLKQNDLSSVHTVTYPALTQNYNVDSTQQDINEDTVHELLETLDYVDINKICRICLSRNELTALIDSKNYETFLFLEGSLDMKKMYKEKYSTNICRLCSIQLQYISCFISKLRNSTEKFYKIFENLEVPKNETKNTEFQEIGPDISSSTDHEEVWVDVGSLENTMEEIIIIREDCESDGEQKTANFSDCSMPDKSHSCDKCDNTHEKKCEYCNFLVVDEQKYEEHLKTEHYHIDVKTMKLGSLTIDGIFRCNICDRTFEETTELNKHLSTHIEHNYQCDLCGKIFVDDIILEMHLKRVHENNKFDTKLKKVRKKANIPKQQKNHCICKVCNRTFTVKSNLNRHMMIVHGKSSRFFCEICGQKFTVKNSLKYHMYIHTDSKPYTCKLCPKSFRQPNALIRHQRTRHNTQKKFECDICLKKFKTTKGLAHHGLKHSENQDLTINVK